jgi:hypothetical protein
MSLRTSSCVDCRHGVVKSKKIKGRFDKETKQREYKLIPTYHCRYTNVTHSLDQVGCDSYVGEMTMFEYLMMTQPDEVNKLLTAVDLKVVSSRNKWGFDFK